MLYVPLIPPMYFFTKNSQIDRCKSLKTKKPKDNMDTKNTNLVTKLHHTTKHIGCLKDDYLEKLSVYHLVYGFKIDPKRFFKNTEGDGMLLRQKKAKAELKIFEKSIPKPFGLYANKTRRDYIFEDEDTWVIGYKFGEVKGLYENLHFTYKNELQLAQPVPESVVKMFQTQYPDQEGGTYGLLDNVDIGNQAFGKLMHGYWATLEDPDPDSDGYDISDINLELLELGIDGITALFPAHGLETLGEPYKKNIFIGVDIESFCSDDSEDIGAFLTKVHKSSPQKLPSRTKILDILAKTILNYSSLNPPKNPEIFDKDLITLTKKPILAFIPALCTCCS